MTVDPQQQSALVPSECVRLERVEATLRRRDDVVQVEVTARRAGDGELFDLRVPAVRDRFEQVDLPGQGQRSAMLRWPSGEETLSLEYTLPLDPGGRLVFAMSDLVPGGLLERYLPASLERVAIGELVVRIEDPWGPVLANGEAREGRIEWRNVRSSSPFLYVADAPRVAATAELAGVPVQLFADANLDAPPFERALERVEAALAALVQLEPLGRFPHGRLLVHLHVGQGMEYAGAVSSAVHDLPHEIVHQWLGRGRYPACGADGWIDEAAATLLTEETLPAVQQPIRLYPEAHAEWTRATPRGSYDLGARVLAALADEIGLDELLRVLTARADLSTPGLVTVLEHLYPRVAPAFRRWVTGYPPPGRDPIPNPYRVVPPPPPRARAPKTRAASAPTGTVAASSLAPLGAARGAAAAAAAQIWQGPALVKSAAGVPILCAYRSAPASGTVIERWAHVSGERLNPYSSGAAPLTRVISTPASEPSGAPNPTAAQFQVWAEGVLGTDDLEYFTHTVTSGL